MNDPEIKSKIIIVTGASKGIGLAVSRLLAGKGAQIVLASRDPEALEKASVLVEAQNQNRCPLFIPTDIRSESAVKAMITQVVDRYGRIDILINNAGVLVYGPMTSVTGEAWDRVIDTNLKGPFLCTREVLPVMDRQGHGQIINVASGAGITGFPNLAVYCASKFGLIGLSEALRKELASTNIKISYLCPGYVDTEMLHFFPEDLLKKVSPTRPEEVADQIFRLIAYPETFLKRKGSGGSSVHKGIQWINRKISG